MSKRMLALVVCAVAVLPARSGGAEVSSDFYAGKTVKIVIGAAVGGGYGVNAQLIANHVSKFVPGHPTVIVESMPGASGLRALNYVANVAPRDGTVLIVPMVNIVQDGLLSPSAKFDPARFQWIWRMTNLVQVGITSSRSKVRSLADAKTRELVAGGLGANNATALNPRILNMLAGTKFKIVTGYKGNNDVAFAWERGEVDVFTADWELLVARYGDRLKAGLVYPLYVHAMQRPQELANVPLVREFGRNDAERAFLQIYSIGTEIGRSLAAPPGVPKDRVAIWSVAFKQLLDDPQFRQEVAKASIRLDPLDGERLAASVADVVNLPQDTIAKAREFYERLLAEVR